MLQAWQKFEDLVARIQQGLGGDQFLVQQDVRVQEPTGAEHQVDVLLTSKAPYFSKTLVSCKSSADPVGMDHVREWSDVVHQTGAAAGVIVSPTGYTAGALELARNPVRRVSLWIARPLTDNDFPPGTRHYTVTHQFFERQPRFKTFVFDAVPADGRLERGTVRMELAEKTRATYYLRDADDNVVGNLWDDYLRAIHELRASGSIRIQYSDPRFFVVEGRRVRFNFLEMACDVIPLSVVFDCDLAHGMYGYENALTGEVKAVPLA